MSRESRKPEEFDLYLWQAVQTIVFSFTTLFQLCQLFITARLDIALYKTNTHILVLNIQRLCSKIFLVYLTHFNYSYFYDKTSLPYIYHKKGYFCHVAKNETCVSRRSIIMSRKHAVVFFIKVCIS